MYKIMMLLTSDPTSWVRPLRLRTYREKIAGLRRALQKTNRKESINFKTAPLHRRRLITWSLLFTLVIVVGPLRATVASERGIAFSPTAVPTQMTDNAPAAVERH